jgi:L-lactate dehydrogenase complex protein LldF
LSRLPESLEQAEANLTKNGVRVLWAVDGDEVNRLVLEIIERHAVKSVVKSKSMVSEEVGLNDALEARDIEVVETDLGLRAGETDGPDVLYVILVDNGRSQIYEK